MNEEVCTLYALKQLADIGEITINGMPHTTIELIEMLDKEDLLSATIEDFENNRSYAVRGLLEDLILKLYACPENERLGREYEADAKMDHLTDSEFF